MRASLHGRSAVGEPAALHLHGRHSQATLGDTAIEAGAALGANPTLDAVAQFGTAGIHVTKV